MSKSLEELQLELLETQEALRVASEERDVSSQRVKELEKLNTKLFNKVAVSFEKAVEDPKEDTTMGMEDFTKSLLGGK